MPKMRIEWEGKGEKPMACWECKFAPENNCLITGHNIGSAYFEKRVQKQCPIKEVEDNANT